MAGHTPSWRGEGFELVEEAFDEDVNRFFLNEVDTVPQMEALLLLWENRSKEWTAEDLAQRLYVDAHAIADLMAPLGQRRLVAIRQENAPLYSYQTRSADADRLMDKVAGVYRHNLVRATTIIHSKAPQAVREFARAFKFRKERD